MAIKLTTQYLSENEFLYDVAQSTGKFDTAMYEQQKELGTSEQYAQLIAGTLTTEPKSAFDNVFYDKLSSEDKLAYITQKYYTDVDSDQYKKNEEYFKQKEQEIKNKEIYEGLSGFQKAANTVGGWVGTALNSVLGIAEGVVDFLGIAAGQLAHLSGIPLITGTTQEVSNAVKDFIAKDVTGYAGVQKALNNYHQAYTFIDKNGLAKGINDLAANFGQRITAFIPVIGPALYWTAIGGNLAEQNIHDNPDIDWSVLMLSVGLGVGVEAVTEWAGGKLFPDDILSGKLFGKSGTGIASSFWEKLLINFVSEGLEEGVAEFLGSLVHASLVTGDEKDVASFKDILYASLIGGIMGAGTTTITSLATTPKYSVINGELVETATLSKEEKKLAKNLGFRGSYELVNQIDRTQQALQQPTAVASLMTKYGTSLSDIRKNHAQEYQEAIDKDIAVDEKKADMVLDLSNLLQTIGIDQFVKSAELLNESVDKAREMVDNFLNHTDTLNKQASEVFSKQFPDQTFTPQQTTSQEQVVSEGLRKAFPQYKFVFGKYGSKNGQPIRQINVNDKNKYVFLESGLVDKLGVEQTISRIIRQHVAQDVMTRIDKLPANKTDALVTLITDKAVKYKDLTESQKRTIAQIICFDPIKNKKVFNQSKQVHQDVFNYITKQAGFVKDLGVKNKTNQIRYRDLMKIRETFMNAISRTVYSKADIRAVRNKYNLTEDELTNKIVFKTRPTILNKNSQLMNLDMTEQGNAKHTAMQMLLDSRLDTTVDFDWNRLYDSTYYTTDFVESLMQNEKNMAMFEPLLREYINNQFNTELDLNDRDSLILFVNNNMSPQEIQKSAQIVLTDEFVQANKDSVLNSELGSMLYTLSGKENVVTEQDGVILTDNQIQGTGELDFIIGDISDGNILLSGEQRKDSRKSTRDVFRRVPSSAAEYTTNTSISNLEFSQQNDTTIDDHQKALRDDYKKKTGLNLHFFKDAVVYKNEVIDSVQGFVSGTDVYVKYDGTLTNEQINLVMEHEATHKRRDAEPEKYTDLQTTIEKAMSPEAFNELYTKYERLYESVYGKDDPRIEEEMIINIAVGMEKPTYINNETGVVKALIKGFMKTSTKLMTQKISEGVNFSIQNKQETSMQQKINKAESPKQIADVITAIIEAAPLEMSETKGYGDEGTRMYKKTSDEMRRKYASLWTKITQENYDKVRDELVKSDYEYADEALLIFDRFTRAYAGNSTKFDEATKKKIMEVGSRKQTIAAISQGLQSAELANEHSFGETAAAFEKDGYKVTVSNDTVKEYVPEMANKKEFIKELDKEISNIEEQIKTAETDIDAAELNNQLDKAVEKRIVMSEGTNEEIMDWVIKNEDIVTKASKLQKEVFEQMVEKGEIAQKEGKKAVTILVDEKTGLPKPFPKATQFIEKTVKRLKSFRMWAMLTSPVSWVRNWVGNAGMTALDGMTNSLEKFITSKQKVMSQQELAKLEKQHQELSRKEKLTDAEKSKLAQLSNQIARNYDFKFVETKASKDLRKQIADDYKDVIQQILNGEDVKYESSAEKAAAITRAERKITRASQNTNLGQKLWAACQSMTDWGLNTGWFGDNAVVVNSLVKNFANMVESNKTYLIKSLTTEYGKDGRGMSAERKALVEKALKTKDSMDIVNAMSKHDVDLFMDSCKQRTFEQYFKNSNWLSQWASNLSKKHPIAASLTSLVLPFPKVAANILSMAYKYSPLGFLSAVRQWSVVKQMDAAGYEGVRDAFARAKAGRTTAQATVGSFMMLAGLILASLGFIDIDDDDYLGPSLKVGDWKVSLSNLAPSMTTFSVGSAMMWAWKNDQSATLKALDVLYDNTLLGNIENVFRYGDPSKYIENLSINYFSQYVPAVLKLFAKFTTNQEMIDKSGSYFAKLGKTFASGIPGAANLLPKKINPYTGETLTGTGTSNVFFNFIEALSPLDMRFDVKSATQKEAERLATESSGLSGSFKVNDKEYVVDKVTYSKYRANYIQDNFDKILSGDVKVTVEDENGKRITTTYDKLNDKQKKNVINRLYTDATTMTKIKWWTDQGNKYVVTNRDQYNEYRKMFNNIIYKKTWTKSKFVES